MKVYFAADHAGFDLKGRLISAVQEAGYETEDCGAFSFDQNDDYPAFIHAAAAKLSADAGRGVESRAIVIGASGQGEAMVANRHRGVRCALYYGATGTQTDAAGKKLDVLSSTREHNNANALSLGARFLDANEAVRVTLQWLKEVFGATPRHVRRIDQIDAFA